MMNAKQRLTLEVRSHRKSIDDILFQIKHHKSIFNDYTLRIQSDVEGINDASNYGIIYETSDRLCKYFKQLKDLQEIIQVKAEMILTLK